MSKRVLGKHYLREWREYRGLSLRKLAAQMESEPGEQLMSHANVGRVETLQQPYSQELLEAAAEALGCSVVELLTVDPTIDDQAGRSPEARLRSALLAFGVDREDLGRAVSSVKVFVDDPDEQSSELPPDDQSEPSSRPRERAPTR